MVFAIGSMSSNLLAQGAYVNFNAGYGASMSSQTMGANYTSNSSSSSISSTTEIVSGTLGKGLNLGAALGYMFNENVGAELGLSYLLGSPTTTTSTTTTSTGKSTNESTESAKMFRINPSLVVAASGKKMSPYAKFGVVIGSGSITDENSSKDTEDNSSSTETWVYDGGMALGLSSALGATFELSDKMSFFGELNMINLSYSPTRGELTEWSINGVSILSDLPAGAKEIEFVESTSSSSNDPAPDATKPSKQLKTSHAFGSFGLNIGLRINF